MDRATWFLVKEGKRQDVPYVLAEIAGRDDAVEMADGGAKAVPYTEMRQRYPEALRAWENKDTKPYGREEALFFLGVTDVDDGLASVLSAADHIEAHGIADESPLFAAVARHRAAVEELLQLVRQQTWDKEDLALLEQRKAS